MSIHLPCKTLKKSCLWSSAKACNQTTPLIDPAKTAQDPTIQFKFKVRLQKPLDTNQNQRWTWGFFSGKRKSRGIVPALRQIKNNNIWSINFETKLIFYVLYPLISSSKASWLALNWHGIKNVQIVSTDKNEFSCKMNPNA